MKVTEILSTDDIDKLRAKVQHEYTRADSHTNNWKEETKNLGREYLLPKPTQDKVKIRKVANNLTIRLATFLPDELQVTNVPQSGVLGKDTAQNCDKVFQANFRSMDLKSKYREVLIDDAMQGVGVLAVDGWNEHKQEPIVSYVDSRLCFPDPKNWQDNKMMFFGTKVRKNWYELMEDEAYDKEQLEICRHYVDSDQQEIDRANNDVKGFTDELTADKNQTDLYNHITVFKGSKDDKACIYLTTWGAGLETPVRIVKMRALNDGERADPSTIDFGVKLFRAKPVKGSFAGISLIDDIGQFQDIETLLTNLQIYRSKLESLGGKTFINQELGIDLDDAQNQTGPGDIIPFKSANPQINAQNGIYEQQTQPVNPILQNTIQYVDQLSQEADPSGSALAQGLSEPGSQTNGEIQTRQQNINNILQYMAGNYMDSFVGLWESIYRSYAANMSPQKKKEIVVVEESGNTDSYGFKKNEFISKGDAYIIVSSRTQEEIRMKKDFAIMLSLDGSMSQVFAPGSTELAKWKRALLNNSGIRALNGEDYFALSQDERLAHSHVEMLNNDIEVKTPPQPGQDHNVFIQIYKTGLDTDARNKAIQQRELILATEPKEAPQEPTGQGGVASQLGASMLANDRASQTASLGDVQA